jgi:CubicO group peptidase (beta-lactamase class C family)
MRTGTRFREDYGVPDAEITVTDRVYGWAPDDGAPRPADATAYFTTLVNDGPHGGPFRYRSILTDVLGWVLEKASGQRFADLVADELWQPMGAEHDADITLDVHGNAVPDGGISATLRDVGRIGLLALGRGQAAGGQVIGAKLSTWPDPTSAPLRRATIAAVKAIAQALSC